MMPINNIFETEKSAFEILYLLLKRFLLIRSFLSRMEIAYDVIRAENRMTPHLAPNMAYEYKYESSTTPWHWLLGNSLSLSSLNEHARKQTDARHAHKQSAEQRESAEGCEETEKKIPHAHILTHMPKDFTDHKHGNNLV